MSGLLAEALAWLNSPAAIAGEIARLERAGRRETMHDWRPARLSTRAQLIYYALRYWRETRRERAWSRRELHRRLLRAKGRRGAAALDARLAELVAAGLLRRYNMVGLYAQHGPQFVLADGR